jgi:hypothetical protein
LLEGAVQSPWVAVDAETIPAKLARELRDAWEDFVDDRPREDDDPGTPHVRDQIADSWQRSRDAGVDPSGRRSAPSIVEHNGVRDIWEAHPLAGASSLIMQLMGDAAVAADNLLVLSDADGMLLRIRGETRLRNRAADEMNFVEGALWSEAGAGTNAIGTAVAADHAVQVFAAEHFTEPVQRWTCAAAPVIDPETGKLLGVIDLTGDMTSVNPHSLAVVAATARAVEEVLRGRLRDREDRLRVRYASLLEPSAAGAALITGSGRVLLDPAGRWADVGATTIPAGGGVLLLPSGNPAVAEPVEDHDLYVVRPQRSTKQARRTVLRMRVLGDGPPEVRVSDEVVQLRPRHLELLMLLVLHRGRVIPETLCVELYGDEGHPASVRVEMSRLRRLIPDALHTSDYRITCEVDSDFKQVRALLGTGQVTEAVAKYAGPLLPTSSAPGIIRARAELDGWMRQAVITSHDPEAIWTWVQAPSGTDDLIAWLRLLTALDYDDPRRGLAVTRTAALRASKPAAPPL